MDPETQPIPATNTVRTIFFNDRGLRSGWRLLIFLAILTVLFSLLNIFMAAVLPSRPAPGAAVTILTPAILVVLQAFTFLVILLASFIMSRIEGRSLGVYGLPIHAQPVFKRFFTGYVLLGFLPLTLVLLIMHWCHVFSFGSVALHGGEIAIYGAEWAVGFLLVGLAEEYLLRGYLLYTLSDGVGFWPAAIVMAVLFGVGHSFNSGETRIGLIATVVFAMFASITLRYSGSLWLAVGAHAGWDWAQSFFYGVSDSGIRAQGNLLNPSFHGPDWLTGGSVGPEGSVVTLVFWVLMTLAFVLLYRPGGPALVITADRQA